MNWIWQNNKKASQLNALQNLCDGQRCEVTYAVSARDGGTFFRVGGGGGGGADRLFS